MLISNINIAIENVVDVAQTLISRNISISLAESCTGGLVSHLLTRNPGISKVFWGSVVAYSNDAKVRVLGVQSILLERFGAVSFQVAEAMARGVRERANTDIGIGITGISGPGGGTPEKPVGLVYIGMATKHSVSSHKFQFEGTRQTINERTANEVFHILKEYLSTV